MKKNFISRVVPLFFALVMIFGLIAPAASLTASAASESYSASASVSSVKVNTAKNFYVVKSSADIRSSTNWLYSKLSKIATLDKNSLVQVSGSTGDFYKVSLYMNGQQTTGYIKKSELKAAPKTSTARFCYTLKSAALRRAPFEKGDKTTVAKGSVLYVVGSLENALGSKWVCIYRDGIIQYMYSENVKQTNKITLTVTGQQSLYTGNNVQYKCTVKPSGITGIKWSSSDTKLAKVNSSGVVSPKAGGDVTITAKLGDIVSANFKANVVLDVDAVFQSKNYTCSAASALAVLRYKGKAKDVSDTTLYSSIDGYVYKIVNVLNSKKYLGSDTYCWQTFKSIDTYEKAIRTSLRQDSPVIARVSFPEKYFNYKSNGHYTTIIGIYEKDGETWVICADSFANRYSSNDYCNKKTGIVHVPLDEMYWYNSYQGKDSRYLIYNP